MNRRKPSRRKFIASGAAVAGAAAGAFRPTSAQTPVPAASAAGAAAAPGKKDIKELIAYGERSRFVNSIPEAAEGRPSPRPPVACIPLATSHQDSPSIGSSSSSRASAPLWSV